jgi:hypothetical protein
MNKNYRFIVPVGLAIFGLGMVVGNYAPFTGVAEAQSANRIFELRTYTAHPGRLEELHARFGDHTVQLFERHGMTNIGYFGPADEPRSEDTLVYLLAHASREAADASWAAFRADPDWQRVAEESRQNGRLVANVDSVFLNPTTYSKMK